jgi:hypothetical protein
MKYTTRLLIGVLLCSLFTGCGKSPQAPTPTPDIDTNILPIMPPIPSTNLPHRRFGGTRTLQEARPTTLKLTTVAPTPALTIASLLATPATQLKLFWNPSVDPTTNYNVYIGTTNGIWSKVVAVGNVTNYTALNLVPSVTYYFTTTAIGIGGESLPSNVVTYSVPILTPPPSTAVVSISGIETNYDLCNVAFWQLIQTNLLSDYTNNGHCSITYQTNLWRVKYTNGLALYSSTNIINTNWTKLKGTNSFVRSTAIGNPVGAPTPTSVLQGAFIVAWGLPTYNVYVTGDLTQPWTYLTNTTSPYLFVSRSNVPIAQFFKIVPVITNTIAITPQH